VKILRERRAATLELGSGDIDVLCCTGSERGDSDVDVRRQEHGRIARRRSPREKRKGVEAKNIVNCIGSMCI
jgi:hypothetical protein